MWSQFCRTTQLVISDYGECIVLWPNGMNANNHIASAWPSLFSVQLLNKFSLYRTRRIVKFRSLGRLPKESLQVLGPLKRSVTMHQESNNNFLIFCISEKCVPSSGQVSNVLLVFVSKVIFSFENRRDPWPNFYSFKTIYVFWKGGIPLFDVSGQVFGWNQNCFS
jgi:restriction endonuclease S subunit